MDNKKKADKLYYNQVLLLLLLNRMILGLTYLPELNTPPANQDIWVMLLLSIPYTIVFTLPLLYLGNKFSQYNFFEYIEMIMGKFLGKIIGIFYTIDFLINLSFFTSAFVEILDSSLYDETPTVVNVVILMITCTYIVYKGIMNLGRLGQFIVPFIIALYFILALLGIKNYDFEVFLPILRDSTFKDLNKGAIISSLRYTDILILIMMVPYLDEKRNINRIYIRALIYSVLIVIMTVVIVQATFGVEYAKIVNFPYYNFTRLIKIGETQGFDLLYVVSWIMGNVIKISGYFYLTTIAIGKVVNRRNQIFIIPVAIVTTILVVLLKDNRPVIATRSPIPQVLIPLSAVAIIVIPLAIVIVYLFRRNKLENMMNSQKRN